MTATADAGDRLKALTEQALSRSGLIQLAKSSNDFEYSNHASTNSSLGWTGPAASYLCLFYTSYAQKKAPNLRASQLAEQYTALP